MSSWWLKLYTIPNVMKVGKSFAIATAILCAGIYFLSTNAAFLYLIYIYPATTLISKKKESLLHNLSFHKLHVPLGKLRTAFFSDLILQATAFLVMFILSILITELFYESEGAFRWTPSLIIMFFGCGIVTLTAQIIYQNRLDSISKFGKFLISISTIILMMAVFMISENTIFAFASTILIMGTDIIIKFYRQEFHEKRTTKSFVGRSILFAQASAISVCFCCICGTISRFEINNDFYSADARSSAFGIFSLFSPELKTETVLALAPLTPHQSCDLYKNAESDFYRLNPVIAVKENDLHNYEGYVRCGKLEKFHLSVVMETLKKNNNEKYWKNKEQYSLVRHQLIKRYPEARSLPAKLNKPHREIATEKYQ